MKKIIIEHKGSFINTTKNLGIFILVIGIIASIVLFAIGSDSFYEEDSYYSYSFVIFFSSFFLYAMLSGLSKILEHLLYIRKYFESKAFDEDKVFTEDED